MRYSEMTSSSVSPEHPSEAGPSSSSSTISALKAINGHATNGATNGFAAASPASLSLSSNGVGRRAPIPKVTLPGTALYNDSDIDREEFVRLVIQTLRDVGYAYVIQRVPPPYGRRLTSHTANPPPFLRKSQDTSWKLPSLLIFDNECSKVFGTRWKTYWQSWVYQRTMGLWCVALFLLIYRFTQTRYTGSEMPHLPAEVSRIA
jgi:hypothetical protein